MIVLLYLFLIVLLCCGLYMFAGQELMLLNLMIIGLMLFFAWKGYQELHELTALWAGITTWGATTWAYVVASWKEFFGGLTTALSWMGFGLGMTIMLVIATGIIWPLANKLAERRAQGRVDQAEARAAEAERQAEEEREKRVEAERRADAAEALARRAAAGQAEAERLYEGLIGQFHQAISVADRRGKDLKEMRAKRRAERGELPVREIEEIIKPTTNSPDKGPPSAQGKKRPSKGRSPKRSRLPPRLRGR